MTPPIGDDVLGALRTGLDRASKRAVLAASNLANLDTPGYRAMELRFDELLTEEPTMELRRTTPLHLGPMAEEPSPGVVVEQEPTRMRNDGNTVDVDREMLTLGEMQGRYTASVEMVRKRFALFLYSITDGRGGAS